jgi:adenylosuccinate lyase
MIMLTDKGMGRQDAHAIAREASMRALSDGTHFADELKADAEVAKVLSDQEIGAAMDPRTYLGTAGEQVDRVLELAEASWGYSPRE